LSYQLKDKTPVNAKACLQLHSKNVYNIMSCKSVHFKLIQNANNSLFCIC